MKSTISNVVMKSSNIEEVVKFLIENKSDAKDMVHKWIDYFESDDGKHLLQACEYCNVENKHEKQPRHRQHTFIHVWTCSQMTPTKFGNKNKGQTHGVASIPHVFGQYVDIGKSGIVAQSKNGPNMSQPNNNQKQHALGLTIQKSADTFRAALIKAITHA